MAHDAAHLNTYYAILALPQIPYNCTECAIGAFCHKLLVIFKQALLKSAAAQATQDKSGVLSNCKQSIFNNVIATCSHILQMASYPGLLIISIMGRLQIAWEWDTLVGPEKSRLQDQACA